jgi:tetratricopeptide (TPR) repeat protein
MNFRVFVIWMMSMLGLGFSSMANKGHYEDLYAKANYVYKAGNFDSAKVLYSEIIQNGMVSSELFFNLGNTFFKKGNIPEAILYFERALRIAPNDEDIQYNLNIANTYITDKITPLESIFFKEWWDSITYAFSVSTWAVLFILLLAIASALITLYSISSHRKMKQLGLIGGAIVFGISLIVLLITNSAFHRLNKDQAIVFSPTVNVKSEPSINSTDQFVIHEGLKVEIIDSEGDWTRIRLSDGNSGWLQSQSIERI